MTLCDSVMSIEFYSSYGTNVLDHLAADGTGLTGLRNIDLVVALHIISLLFAFSRKDVVLLRENDFFLSAPIAYPNCE